MSKIQSGLESDMLAFDPFAGDFGDQGDKIFSNKMIAARAVHSCWNCNGIIAIGERSRAQVQRIDGDFNTARWCNLCCQAMADSIDSDDAYCKRSEK